MMQKSYEKLRLEKRLEETKENTTEVKGEKKKVNIEENTNSYSEIFSDFMNKNNLLRGILYSEILGPPKSRKK